MKKLLFAFLGISLLFLSSCLEQFSEHTIDEVNYGLDTKEMVLQSILDKGVTSLSEFDVLIESNIFPFSEISPKAINEFRNSIIFHDGYIKAFGTYSVFEELTLDESLVFFQLLYHANPVIENEELVNFIANDTKKENIYTPNPKFIKVEISFGLYGNDVLTYRDCLASPGGCTFISF